GQLFDKGAHQVRFGGYKPSFAASFDPVLLQFDNAEILFQGHFEKGSDDQPLDAIGYDPPLDGDDGIHILDGFGDGTGHRRDEHAQPLAGPVFDLGDPRHIKAAVARLTVPLHQLGNQAGLLRLAAVYDHHVIAGGGQVGADLLPV